MDSILVVIHDVHTITVVMLRPTLSVFVNGP